MTVSFKDFQGLANCARKESNRCLLLSYSTIYDPIIALLHSRLYCPHNIKSEIYCAGNYYYCYYYY